MTSTAWATMSDDELLDRLGTALAPAGPEATAADPVVVPLVIAPPPPSQSWRRPLAWAAAILVVVGVAVGIAARDDGTDGVKTIDPAVPGTVSPDPDLRAAQLAMAALEAALATGEPTTIAPADETLRAALALLEPDERASLGSRPDELLAEANAALTVETPTPTTTSTTAATSGTPPSTPSTATDPGSTQATPTTPTSPTTSTTIDDHDGGDNSGPGSGSSGPGSGSVSSGSGSDSLSGSDDASHG